MVEMVSADRLAAMQDDGESYTLVDTRPADSFEAWHVRGAVNYQFGPDEELTGDRLTEFRNLVDGGPIVTICAKGISSSNLAAELERAAAEYDAMAVEGGMEAWSQVYDVVPVPTASERIDIRQIQRRAKGCLGYIVADADAGEAAVVDATRNTDVFRNAAEDAGYGVTRVFDTHVHADHISGGRELADEVGATYHLGARATGRDVAYEFTPLERNQVVEVGDVAIKAVFAPGHTTEMVNYLVESEALLTADTLFVNATGRTELEFGEGDAERGARLLYETLHRTVLAEPDSVTILPGHATVTPDGEFADGTPGHPITTTVGAARTGVDELQTDEDAFVDHHENPGEEPPNYETILAINRGARDVDDDQQAVELEMGPNNCSV